MENGGYAGNCDVLYVYGVLNGNKGFAKCRVMCVRACNSVCENGSGFSISIVQATAAASGQSIAVGFLSLLCKPQLLQVGSLLSAQMALNHGCCLGGKCVSSSQ